MSTLTGADQKDGGVLWFRVQGSRVYCLLIGMKASYEWGMRNEGSGFAEIEGSGRSYSGIRYLTYDVSRRSG